MGCTYPPDQSFDTTNRSHHLVVFLGLLGGQYHKNDDRVNILPFISILTFLVAAFDIGGSYTWVIPRSFSRSTSSLKCFH